MKHIRRPSRPLLTAIVLLAALAAIVGCASIGTPDGGPFDEDPPVVLGSTPLPGALNVTDKKVVIDFDEYIKIEKANEKVVISPPQKTQPIIKTNGKKIIVTLEDSLIENATYTIDFNDAIVDNNEGNPLGNYAFTFSTGDHIDTLACSGLVLDATNLEPVQGILVGLHSNQADSAFTKLPFERVGRTDADGHFSIKGIAPGQYRIYALQDMNQNFFFDQKSEMLSWSDSLVIPSTEVRMEPDTTWIDSLTIDTIRILPVTHYLPEDIVLLAFTETPTFRYLVKSERPALNRFNLYFSTPSDTLPHIEPLNFPADSSYIVQRNVRGDSLTYWMRDTTYYYQDTLAIALTYYATDTLGLLSPRTDTLSLVPKKTRAKILQDEEKKRKDEEKEREKRLKRGDSTEVKKPTPVLPMKVNASATMDLNAIVTVTFDEPIVAYSDTSLHLTHKVDTLWEDIPFVFRQRKGQLMTYELLGEWRPDEEYKFLADSAAFTGLYGLTTKKSETPIKFNSLDKYSSFILTVQQPERFATPGAQLVAQLIDKSDKPIRQQVVKDGHADFYFVKPATYYIRMFWDLDSDGEWDTGLYDTHTPAEAIWYYTQPIEMRENWDYNQDWDPLAIPVDKQKPDELKKTKSEKKEKKSKNQQREEEKRKKAAGVSSGSGSNFGF